MDGANGGRNGTINIKLEATQRPFGHLWLNVDLVTPTCMDPSMYLYVSLCLRSFLCFGSNGSSIFMVLLVLCISNGRALHTKR
jgi:hypothetical protein